MKYKFWLGILIGVVLGFVLLSIGSATRAASTPTTYDLSWNTIGSGGTSFTTAGNYSLGGTIGQSATGPLSGGSYKLNSGFWQAANYSVYLPIVLK
jgi:hypothetical protein